MNPHPDDKWRHPLVLELAIESIARRRRGKRCTTGALDVILLRAGGIPEHHYRVANELVDSSPLGNKYLR